jgi:hypothetical protein
MATHKRLVTQHLESVSWRLLEEYQQIIRDLSRKHAGVYALYKGSELYYVGLASNLMNRVKAHIKDRHKGAWDRFSVYLTVQDDHIRELEALLLRIVAPGGNRVGGRFVKSTNLLPQLNRLISESDKDHKAELLGGWVAERRRRTKAKRARGKGALRGLVIRRLSLRAERNGWAYRASLRRDGTISYDRKTYDSPNAAARAALGKPAGGWHFWHYKSEDGDWVPLASLKKH